MDADGDNLRWLTSDTDVDEFPLWSPDGSKILYISKDNGNSDIFIMDADGGNQLPLTFNPYVDTDTAWWP
jgi:Tol biopolymer transport system component